MSATNILFLNFMIHSALLGALGWLLVRCVIRDALRRCAVANLALLFCLIAPFSIFMADLFPAKAELPVWRPLQDTLAADWRVAVVPMAASPVAALETTTSPPPSSSWSWDVDAMVTALRWVVCAGIALMLGHVLFQTIRVQRWISSLRAPNQAEQAALPPEADPAQMRVFDHGGSPCVAGWCPPRMAVPASSFQELTHSQWRWLLRHEGEHLRCHDTVVVLLQHVHRALLWWNPFVHALMEEHARAREETCDATAVAASPDRAAYADFLLAWAARPACLPPGCVMGMAQSLPARRLQLRLTAVMEARGVRKRLGALFTLGCAAGVVVAPVMVASVGLATLGSPPAQAAGPAPGTEETDDGALFTRTYVVPPAFTGHMTAKVFLEERGITFPAGAQAVVLMGSSKMVVRNTRPNLEKIAQIVEKLPRTAADVLFTCQLVEAGHLYGTHGQILSDAQRQALVREMSQKPGVDLLTAPKLTAVQGAKASIEVLRSNPADADQFVGVRLILSTQALQDGKVGVEAKTEVGEQAGATRPWPPPKGNEISWNKVRRHTTGATAALASGETLVFHLTTADRPITVLVSVQALSRDGKPAADFKSTTSTTPPPRPEDKALLPGAAFDGAMQHLKAVEEALVQKVRLTGHMAEIRGDVNAVLGTLAFLAKADPAPEIQPLPAKGVAGGGIITPPQLAVLLRDLRQKKDVVLTTLADISPLSGQPAAFKLAGGLAERELTVKAEAGADERTVALEAVLPNPARNQKDLVITRVTLWSGQTLVLSDAAPETPGLTHLLFITPTLLNGDGKRE